MCAGYVGYFCLAAGVNLACNVEVVPSAKRSHISCDMNPYNAHLIVAFCRQRRNITACRMECDLIYCLLQINTFQSWKNIANADALIKLAPAAGATLVLLLTLKLGRSPLALPAVLVCIPVRPRLVPLYEICWPVHAGIASRPSLQSWRLQSRHVSSKL